MIAGLATALLSFGVTFLIFVLHLMGMIRVEGWASLTLSLYGFLAGCLLFAVGLTGLYAWVEFLSK